MDATQKKQYRTLDSHVTVSARKVGDLQQANLFSPMHLVILSLYIIDIIKRIKKSIQI